ncbi:hypothetical protein SLEP1_g52353 [Rubroshorea leprosula]|uniref:Uncharacterized protein n=1 Tax=Rubroshorea leprosula TaxID=152421 RepID=A0AAV5M606_9ROSI|nr:hypothetical protein SLEP1_g52353 [Rubroshorea leprosula]
MILFLDHKVLISWRCSISVSWEGDRMLVSLLYLE